MVKSTNQTTAPKTASKALTTNKASTRSLHKRVAHPDKGKQKNLNQEMTTEASKDVEMMDMTADSENNQNSTKTPGKNTNTGQKDPPNEIQTQQDTTTDDSSHMSTKSDDTDKMTNKDTSTTSSNNPFQPLDPNARAFTPASQAKETRKDTELMDRNKKKDTQQKIIKRNFNSLYSLKLSVTDNKNAAEEMQRVLVEWYKELKEVDSSVIIYDWKNDTKTRAISKSTEITNKVAPMRHFFYQIRPRSTRGHVWCSVHIGHGGPASELGDGMDWWYKEKKEEYTNVHSNTRIQYKYHGYCIHMKR